MGILCLGKELTTYSVFKNRLDYTHFKLKCFERQSIFLMFNLLHIIKRETVLLTTYNAVLFLNMNNNFHYTLFLFLN